MTTATATPTPASPLLRSHDGDLSLGPTTLSSVVLVRRTPSAGR